MHKLNKTYFKVKQILGDYTEPLESIQLVETYRRYWKPEKVRVVLLAESHVFTSDEDRKVTIQPLADMPRYPTQYARFVYCLGYGEKTLKNGQIHPGWDGTPQFWKIFFSCNNPVSSPQDFSPILKKTHTTKRLENKSKLLKDLQSKGIWLVDASIIALYKGGEKIPHMYSALKASWQSYTRDVVTSAHPDHVICIGKGVASIVEQDLKKLNIKYKVVSQPNARLSSEEHMANYKMYSKICNH